MVGWDKLREARHQAADRNGPRRSQVAADAAAAGRAAIGISLSEEEKDRFDHIMAIYAAMIDRLDRSVGTLVEGLKKRGVLDNTLIMFMCDNGGNAESGPRGRLEGEEPGGPKSTVFLGQNWATLANTPFRRYKHFTHEGGISTPLIVHWPAGIDKARNGKLEPQPGHLVDVMATVVEVTGAKYPTEFNGHKIQPMEGASLVPAFAGKPLDRKQPIYLEHEGNRGDPRRQVEARHEVQGPVGAVRHRGRPHRAARSHHQRTAGCNSAGEGMERLGRASGCRCLGRARSQRFRQRDQPPCQSDRRPKDARASSGEKSGWGVGSSTTAGAFSLSQKDLLHRGLEKPKVSKLTLSDAKGGKTGATLGSYWSHIAGRAGTGIG